MSRAGLKDDITISAIGTSDQATIASDADGLQAQTQQGDLRTMAEHLLVEPRR